MDDATALMEQPGTETEPARTNKRWELAEDALLICRAADGMELAAIALRLDRPEDGVRRRLKRMCDGKVTVPTGYEEQFKRARALHGHGPQRHRVVGRGRLQKILNSQQQQITALHQAVERIGRMVAYLITRDAAGDDEACTELNHVFGQDVAQPLSSQAGLLDSYRQRRQGIAEQIAAAAEQMREQVDAADAACAKAFGGPNGDTPAIPEPSAPLVKVGQGDYRRAWPPETPESGTECDTTG